MHLYSQKHKRTQQHYRTGQKVMKDIQPSSNFTGNTVSQLETNHKAIVSTSIFRKDDTDLNKIKQQRTQVYTSSIKQCAQSKF